MKSPLRLAPLAAALVLAAAPAAAQSPEAAAAKRFRKGAKEILATQKQEVGEAVAAIVATLDQLGADIEAGSFSAKLLDEVRVALDAQSEVAYLAQVDAAGSGASAAVTLLQELNGSEPDDGLFAATFYAGSGGVYDDFVAAVFATTARAYKKVDKASAALVKRAAASGVGLVVVIPPPAAAHNVRQAPNEKIITGSGASAATIDFLIAGSRFEETGDGILVVGGHADQGDGVPVSVNLFGSIAPVAFEEEVALVDVVDRRWSALVDLLGDGLAEGNYILSLRKGTVFLLNTLVGVR